MHLLRTDSRPDAACRRCSFATTLFLFLLGGAATPLAAQQRHPANALDYPARYSEAQIQADFALFRRALQEAHPGLHHHRSRAEMAEVFEKAETELAGVSTEVDFYKVLAAVVVSIQDGHTGLEFSEGFERFFMAQPSLLPFKLLLLDRRPYLYIDYTYEARASGSPDLVGAEVLAIDGRPIDEVLASMLAYLPMDGANLTGKYKLLEATPRFGLLYQVLFGPVSEYRLLVKKRGATETSEVRLSAVPKSVVDRLWESRYLEDAAKAA